MGRSEESLAGYDLLVRIDPTTANITLTEPEYCVALVGSTRRTPN